ncbi:MBL fold metallo-hydrolase [Intrasporangium sp.]|uniref:MBL fold metallo-hydrolase n=1 Tax=Intrasporangium sp. TaxID=1925024 RepID=UPI003222154A
MSTTNETNATGSSGTAPVRVITLGTAGGPAWWREHGGARVPAGISTALVVGEDVYLVDAGYGAGAQLTRAGLDMSQLRAVFITHLHSDHVVDLPGLVLFGTYEIRDRRHTPVPVIGPGDRGMLPPVSPQATVPPRPLHPEAPTPGVAGLLEHIGRAFATDFNDRILDALHPPPTANFQAREITLPDGTGFHPNENVAPDMEPFEVYRDEAVRVTATLVPHPPLAPAFAFRLDTAAGSVTISGDTAPSDNLVRLARETDLLLHEAIDAQWLMDVYGTTDLDDSSRANLAHHRRAHTTTEEAGVIARRAGARRLGLHHLVPGDLPRERWLTPARRSFPGEVLVPGDLDEITLP